MKQTTNIPLAGKPSNVAAMAEGAVQKNINTILDMEKGAVNSRSAAERVADKTTKFAGSTPFIIIHAVWFIFWITVNENLVPGIKPFDPYPFSFLTLVVSLEAIFLTLLVLMSQNRMTKEADKRAHLDLQINMLDEQETTMILRIVKNISTHLGLQDEHHESIEELVQETDVTHVAKTLDEKTMTP
ncbi:MAG: hypothetical protein JWQ27_3328 [Ferruginibacter sp.]|nr:hypothetical protein [Ferruginibacter sp.]